MSSTPASKRDQQGISLILLPSIYLPPPDSLEGAPSFSEVSYDDDGNL
jgi:hypothetical protein